MNDLNNLIELARGLVDSYEEMYKLCYSEVTRIINNHITDINIIEHTLDLILDIYTDKGFYLFMKLLFYYSDIDLEKSFAYLDILKEDRKEEYDEYIKKLSNSK